MKTIQIRTEIPGPKSRALLARREAAIPRGPSLVTPSSRRRRKARGSRTLMGIATLILPAASAA